VVDAVTVQNLMITEVSHLSFANQVGLYCQSPHNDNTRERINRRQMSIRPEGEILYYDDNVRCTFCRFMSRDSHICITCRSICDRDQNGIKQSTFS